MRDEAAGRIGSGLRVGAAGLCLWAATAAGIAPGAAQTAGPSVDGLVRDLMPAPAPARSRGIEAAAPDPCAATRSRGIVVEAGTPVADVIAAKPCFPAINVQVNFDLDSDRLTPAGAAQLDTLAAVLSDPRIKGSTFMLGGHTDARGSDNYNDTLSQRRALAVLGYLVDHHGLAPSQLRALGFGKRNPKAGTDPFDGVNRRVEVVNVSAQ